MDASLMKASALRLRFSQSLASRRQRLSQAMVRSTTQRLGWTTKPFTRSDRLTISVSRSEKAIGGIDASLKQRKGDPVQAELDSAMKRIGELTMQVELLEAKTETFGPLGRRRSRR